MINVIRNNFQKLKLSRRNLGLVLCIIIILSLGFFIVFQPQLGDPDGFVKEPNSGALVQKNALMVMDISKAEAESLALELGGHLTESPKLEMVDIYFIKFPVSNINELNKIKWEIKSRDIEVSYNSAYFTSK